MTKEAFEGKLNALVPQPDPEITAALFAFGQELGQEEACDGVRELLNSMSFVSRHFSAVTTQSVYEIIQHGSAALPGEMVAAAVYLENGNTLQDVAEMADLGMLMCFHCPRDMEELSPLALCVVTEGFTRCTSARSILILLCGLRGSTLTTGRSPSQTLCSRSPRTWCWTPTAVQRRSWWAAIQI